VTESARVGRFVGAKISRTRRTICAACVVVIRTRKSSSRVRGPPIARGPSDRTCTRSVTAFDGRTVNATGRRPNRRRKIDRFLRNARFRPYDYTAIKLSHPSHPRARRSRSSVSRFAFLSNEIRNRRFSRCSLYALSAPAENPFWG